MISNLNGLVIAPKFTTTSGLFSVPIPSLGLVSIPKSKASVLRFILPLLITVLRGSSIIMMSLFLIPEHRCGSLIKHKNNRVSWQAREVLLGRLYNYLNGKGYEAVLLIDILDDG